MFRQNEAIELEQAASPWLKIAKRLGGQSNDSAARREGLQSKTNGFSAPLEVPLGDAGEKTIHKCG